MRPHLTGDILGRLTSFRVGHAHQFDMAGVPKSAACGLGLRGPVSRTYGHGLGGSGWVAFLVRAVSGLSVYVWQW